MEDEEELSVSQFRAIQKAQTEAYFQNNPEKICYLRPDMLGYILNYSNVNS